MRRLTTSELELLALGGMAMGVCYAFASPEFAGAIAWNAGARLACRFYNNRYAKNNNEVKRNEYIQARFCEVPVNLASTTFLSAGIDTYLQRHAQGFDVSSMAISILAKSLAYGVIGQICKDSARVAVDMVSPLETNLQGKKKGQTDELQYTKRCFNAFFTQHTKFSIKPGSITGIKTFLQHIFTGAARHTVNHNCNPDYKTAIDAFAMGALNFTTYLLPPLLIPASLMSTYPVKAGVTICIEMAERYAAHFYNKQPVTGYFAQKGSVDTKKSR